MDIPKLTEKNTPSPNAKEARKKSFLRTVAFYLICLLVIVIVSHAAGKLFETPVRPVIHDEKFGQGSDQILVSENGSDQTVMSFPHPAYFALSGVYSFQLLLVIAILLTAFLMLFEQAGRKNRTSEHTEKLQNLVKKFKKITKFFLLCLIASWISYSILKGYLLRENEKGVDYVRAPSILDLIRL